MFSALEVGGSAALGGDVRLEVEPRTTVLVGRNGAGKSALLERIHTGAFGATGVVQEARPDPNRFAVEVHLRRDSSLVFRYECRWRPPAAPDSPGHLPPGGIDEQGAAYDANFAEIEETCRILKDHVLWQLAGEALWRSDGTTDSVPRGRGLLNWWLAHRKPFAFHDIVMILHHLLWPPAITYIQTGVPRAYKSREAAILPFPWPYTRSSRWERRYEHISTNVRHLTLTLAKWHQTERAPLDELIEVGRRVRIFNDLQVSLFPNPEHSADPRVNEQLAAVSVDGVNLGLLSDGTMRVLEILTALVSPEVSLLFIEEPEIAVHPGLLARLLAEIDAYSTDRQIILSTQSPQVVSWARPEALRLVERSGGVTQVRSLNDEERAHIHRYLDDEGTLGDFIYSGALDG